MHRRSVLSLPLLGLAVPSPAEARSPPAQAQPAPMDLAIAPVASGGDRQGRVRQIGVSATTYKVLSGETGGALFVIEQANRRRGGPPLHVHHEESELFYALEGEYLVQVGDELYPLRAGDCVLGPRGVPHAWAFTGEGTGRLLLSYAPAGKMQAFFDAWEKLGFHPGGYSAASDAALLRTYGMERMGPPIKLAAQAPS